MTEPCKHLLTINGVCQDCGNCGHFVIVNGVCSHCGHCEHHVIYEGVCSSCGEQIYRPPSVPADKWF